MQVARTVDPDKHAARRLHIVDAALSCFAATGYDKTTTASICRAAGIGSGTFFHYFPAKSDVLLAILEVGAQQTRDWFSAREDRSDARDVVLDWVGHTADMAADPRMPGFVRAVGAVMTQPAVAAALADDDEAQRSGLRIWMHRAQQAGQVRTDLSADALTSWIMVLLDGFLSRLAADNSFTAQGDRDTLVEAAMRLLA